MPDGTAGNHAACTPRRQACSPATVSDAAMTTSSQPSVLTTEELACLRACAEGQPAPGAGPVLESLAAKGMLEIHEGRPSLTPAAEHALHPGEPGTVPGLDN